MGLFGGPRISRNITIGLTEVGKRKAEQMEATGPKFEVLTALSENGASTIGEIANEARISDRKATAIVKWLVRAGYAHVVRGGNDE